MTLRIERVSDGAKARLRLSGRISSEHLTELKEQIGGLGPEWHFVGAGDYNGLGVDSFMIQNINGSLFTGTVVNGQARYAQVGGLGPEWSFKG